MSDSVACIIRTPDQRLSVFVSSTLQEVATERVAAREAITRLHLAPVMSELGARPHPPKDLYRAYLDQSDIFVGIAAENGQPDRAARLLGAVEYLSRQTLYVAYGLDRARYERTLEWARSYLDEATWNVAFSVGQTLTLEQAVTFALASTVPTNLA
jgi:hypothetical protein